MKKIRLLSSMLILTLFATGLQAVQNTAFGFGDCATGKDSCPPKNDGSILGDWTKDILPGTSGSTTRIHLQTNLVYDPTVGSYSAVDTHTPQFGGPGKFYRGDYAVTGKSVMYATNYSGGTTPNLDMAKYAFYNDGGFALNSSSQNIELPPDLKPEDIVWARVYWSGNIYDNYQDRKGDVVTETTSNDALYLSCKTASKDLISIGLGGEHDAAMQAAAKQKFIDETTKKCKAKYPSADCETLVAAGLGADNVANNYAPQYRFDGSTIGMQSYVYSWVETYYNGVRTPNKDYWAYADCEVTSLKSYSYTTSGKSFPDRIVADRVREKLNGYRTMTLKADGVSDVNFTSDDKDTFYWLSLNNDRYTVYNNGWFTKNYYYGSLYFLYSASADATQFAKNMIAKNPGSRSIKVTGGNVKSTVTGGGWPTSFGNPRALNTGVLTSNIYIASYGQWSLIIVYDKKKQGSLSNADYKKYYKPKGISIYDGYATLVADTNSYSETTFDISGFYTPKSGNIQAKISTMAGDMVGYQGNGIQGYTKMRYQNTNSFNTLSMASGRTGIIGDFSIVSPGENMAKTIDNNAYKTTSGITSYAVGGNLKNSQTSTTLKYGVGNVRGTGEQSFLSYIAFSVDLYVPNVCYEDHFYNAAGAKDEFSAVKGETIRNVIIFRNEKKDGEQTEEAEGLVVTFSMDSNTSYTPNSLIIDNSLKDTSLSGYLSKVNNAASNPNSNNDIAFLKDNEAGAYKDPSRTKPYTSGGLYENRKFNTVGSTTEGYTNYKIKRDASGNIVYKSPGVPELEEIKGVRTIQSVEFPIGRGAGDSSSIKGGNLKVGESVFVEYNTTLGSVYRPNEFKIKFSQEINGQKIEYNYENNLPKCKDDDGDDNTGASIKILPLDGLRVVNKNVTDSDVKRIVGSGGDVNDIDDELYTQVAGKEFDVALIYTPNFSDSMEIGADGKIKLYDKKGKYLGDITYEEYLKNLKDQMDKGEFNFDSSGLVHLSLVPRSDIVKYGCSKVLLGTYKGNKATLADSVPFVYKDAPDKVSLTGGIEKKVNDGINKEYPQPSFVVDFNGKYHLKLKDLKANYAMKDYTFVVSYSPYGVDNNGTTDEDLAGINAKRKENAETTKCDEKYEKEYEKCRTSTISTCKSKTDLEHAKCLADEMKKCLVDLEKEYAQCLSDKYGDTGGNVVNDQGLWNVCNSDNFSVRPAYIEHSNVNLPIYTGGNPIPSSDSNFQSFKAMDSNGRAVGGYHAVLNDFVAAGAADVMNDFALAGLLDTTQANISQVAPILPAGCAPARVTGVQIGGPATTTTLWSSNSMPLYADFRLRDNNSNVINTDKKSKNYYGALATEDLNTYKKSAKKGSDLSYSRDTKLSSNGFVYTQSTETSAQKTMDFVYYNIGWAGLSLADTSWSAIDQTNGGCIEGSFSNDPDSKGLVGCGVSTKINGTSDNKWVYALFDYQNIEIDMKDLRDFYNFTGGAQNFTFFNNDTLAGGGANTLANMGATLDLEASARLSTAGGYREGGVDAGGVSRGLRVNGGAARGIIPTAFDANCFAEDVTFDIVNTYTPRIGGKQTNIVGNTYGRDANAILTASRNADPTVLVEATAGAVFNGAGLNKNGAVVNNYWEYSANGFRNGINSSDFFINYTRNQIIPRNPLIIVAEDFVANDTTQLQTFAPAGVAVPANCTNPAFNSADPRQCIVRNRPAQPGIYFFNEVNRAGAPINNLASIATNGVGVARFYYGNANNAIIRPPLQRLRAATPYYIQTMVYCADPAGNANNCIGAAAPFNLLAGGAATPIGGNWANYYSNSALTYGAAGVAGTGARDINTEFVTGYAGVASVNVNRSGALVANTNPTPYSELINVSVTRPGSNKEVRINAQPWLLNDTISGVLGYNRFWVGATGPAAWAGQGGVKDAPNNVGSFLDDTASVDRADERNKRISW